MCLYADTKPLTPDSSSPVDFTQEKTDIILAIETEAGWDKQTLTTEGLYQPTGLQIEIDSNGVVHLIYVRKLDKVLGEELQTVDYLVYRTIEEGIVSEEIEVGDLNVGNVAGLGGWRTRFAFTPDNQVYMLREGSTQDLTQPVFNLLIPNGEGNWTITELSGLPRANWYRLGDFLIDTEGRPHMIFADYAYNNSGEPYTSGGSAGRDDAGFHNLWYASSETLDGQGWSAFMLDADPNSDVATLYNDEFWPNLSLDENNNPAVATWEWKVGNRLPGYNSHTVFFLRDSEGNWSTSRTTRLLDNVTYRPEGELAGMGPGLVKTATGWHGVWDSSHPRPFEHSFLRGGIMYRYSPDGKNWTYYQPLAEFSGEGYSVVKIDAQNRLNVLVLGDHTDTQLYLLRYQLPSNNLMEVYPDRRYYFLGEPVTLHARVQSDAVGDYYVAAVSKARPDINQPSETWQLNANLAWVQINSLAELTPTLTIPAGSGLNFNDTIGVVEANQQPFDKPDTDYTIYSLVVNQGADFNDAQQWVTPLFTREITANKSFPE